MVAHVSSTPPIDAARAILDPPARFRTGSAGGLYLTRRCRAVRDGALPTGRHARDERRLQMRAGNGVPGECRGVRSAMSLDAARRRRQSSCPRWAPAPRASSIRSFIMCHCIPIWLDHIGQSGAGVRRLHVVGLLEDGGCLYAGCDGEPAACGGVRPRAGLRVRRRRARAASEAARARRASR